MLFSFTALDILLLLLPANFNLYTGKLSKTANVKGVPKFPDWKECAEERSDIYRNILKSCKTFFKKPSILI